MPIRPLGKKQIDAFARRKKTIIEEPLEDAIQRIAAEDSRTGQKMRSALFRRDAKKKAEIAMSEALLKINATTAKIAVMRGFKRASIDDKKLRSMVMERVLFAIKAKRSGKLRVADFNLTKEIMRREGPHKTQLFWQEFLRSFEELAK